MQSLLTAFKMLPEEIRNIKLSLLRRLKTRKSIDDVRGYLFDLSQVKKQRVELEELFVDPLDTKLPEVLEKLGDFSNQHGLVELSSRDLHREIGLLKEQEKRVAAATSAGKELARHLNGAETIKIKYLLAACDLIQNFDRSLLALRSPDFEGEDFKNLLSKYKAEALALKERREALARIFTLDLLPEISEMEKHCQSLEKSGIFSWFMPKYHAARKFYKNLTQAGKWSGKNARGALRQLINWRKGKAAYEKDEVIKTALKSRFDGVETDFGIFEKIITYYGLVDAALRGLADRRLRDYLCAADTDSLLALPSISEKQVLREFSDETVSGLTEKAAELEVAIKDCENFRTELESLLQYFKSPETFKVNELKDRRNLVLAFNLRRKKLTADEPIKALLGALYDRFDDFRDEIVETLDVAEKLTSQQSDVVNHLLVTIENETVKKNIEIIAQASLADEEAVSALNHLACLIECGPDDLYSGSNRQAFANVMQLAAQDKLGLLAHSTVAQYLKELEAIGFKEIIDELILGGEGCHELSEKVKAVVHQAQAREAFRQHGRTLAKYKGIELNRLRKQLAELDKTILELSRKRLRVDLLNNANPPRGNHTGRRSEWTDKALLDHEITKTRGYVPVRDLTARAGKALLELKPCWMVSPLAVAQYIQKGKIKFDLVIIDEASQMTPEDAVGALARGGQAMIVGDTNQLPPSDFFRKHFEEEESDDMEILTEESILEMANAVFRPARRLRWHYRSRDARLIAFSNKYVYDNDLVIFPGAVDNNSQTGVAFEKVSGLYASGTNPIEAKQMIDAAVRFMRHNPNKSLGLVLLNQKQRDLIIEEMNYVIANDSAVQKYVEHWEKHRDGLESFFVKNLENVQGDERDTIFIGTVYGPEKEGAPVMQRFGPINGTTGKRRLNVLFTRAKERITTFSSMSAADIRANEANAGVTLLKKWLEYSATGKLLMDDIELSKHEPDSMFERYVITQLKVMGCEVIPQVGVAGYFIDIGIKHSQWPHGYIMGVECDGASYHSAKSARDRDRLRQEILEGLGWKLYRIWSTDWFEDPIRQTQKLREVVEERLKELKRPSQDGQLF